MSKTAAFLRPTALVLLGLVLWVGVRWLNPAAPAAPLDYIAPSALSAEHLPQLGAEDLVLPDPSFSPTKVVRTQLAGLADPRSNGVGILQCYCFASPANRRWTGPLEHFGSMVRQGEFASLARPAATLVGKPQVAGPLARVLVTVVGEDEQLRTFTFILSRQSMEPFKNCWMTEGVYPAKGAGPPPAPPASKTATEM